MSVPAVINPISAAETRNVPVALPFSPIPAPARFEFNDTVPVVPASRLPAKVRFLASTETVPLVALAVAVAATVRMPVPFVIMLTLLLPVTLALSVMAPFEPVVVVRLIVLALIVAPTLLEMAPASILTVPLPAAIEPVIVVVESAGVVELMLPVAMPF